MLLLFSYLHVLKSRLLHYYIILLHFKKLLQWYKTYYCIKLLFITLSSAENQPHTPTLCVKASRDQKLAEHSKRREETSLTHVAASTSSNRVDGCRHRGWRVQKEVPVLTALLLLMPASAQPRIPWAALPPVEAVVRAVALVVMQGVGIAWRRGVSGGGRSGWGEGGWRRGLVVVVVWPSRRRPFEWVPPGSGPLLQVVEPECQGGAVFQGGGGVYEGVGQELARLLQVTAMLDGVGQDAWQQAHVLALGFNIARFEQREVGEDKWDDSLLRLTLPLADHPCKGRQNTISIR